MRKILDYSVSHTFERNRSTYFCGKKEGEDQPVIIQILDPHLFSAVEIARLKIDYDLIKTLNITGTQKIIDLIVLKDQLVFIPEDFPAITLRDFMLYRKMDLALFLNIAIQLTATIAELHNNNIIYLVAG